MSRWSIIVVTGLMAAACGADDGDDPGAADAGADAAAACGDLPDPAPVWLVDYQDDLVARLTGARELAPGTTLPARDTGARRAAAAGFLDGAIEDMGLPALRHDYGTGSNVYTEVTATDGGDAWVVFGAHYDTVIDSPGANDNATGVAMVLAAARYLQSVDCRTVNALFVLFDEEEVGLIGSAAFADMLAAGGRDVLSVHTVDQMGWDDDGDRAVELERSSPGLFELYDSARQRGALTMSLVATNTGSTDHVSFRQRGFRAVGLTEEFVSGDTTPHYHLPSDTYDTVNFDYLASTTELVNRTLAEVVTGNLAAALPPAVRPLPLPGGARRFDDRGHGCRGDRVPSSAMTGAVSAKSAADSF